MSRSHSLSRFVSGAVFTALALTGIVACSSAEPGEPETASTEAAATSCKNAKADNAGVCRAPNGRFAPKACCTTQTPATPAVSLARACSVVFVNEALNAGLLEEGLGSIYDVDDEGFFQADEDSTGVSVDSDEAKDKVVTVKPKGERDSYSIRFFEVSNLGVVFHQSSPSAKKELLARIDCRKIPAIERP